MKVLLTGGSGILGQYVSRAFDGEQIYSFNSKDLDIRKKEQLDNLFQQHKFDIVIHLGALTDLRVCEQEKRLAAEINIEGTQNVAEICIKREVPLVFASTYYIYACNQRNFGTEQQVIEQRQLPNYYTVTKYLAEQRVKLVPQHYIVRLGSLYGRGVDDKKFVGIISRKLTAGKELSLVADQFIQPTRSETVANTIVEMIKNKVPYGTYNIVSKGFCSFYQYGCFISEYLLGNIRQITSITMKQYPTTVKQRYILADTSKLGSFINVPIEWDIDLRDYMEKELSNAA